MATRIDWELIKEHVTSNDMLLFAFPRQFQQLLLTNADNLRWLATYRMEQYDFSDWDTLQSVVDSGIDQLMGGIMLSDIIGYIDEIETLLRLIDSKTGCCAPDGTTTYYPAPDMAAPEYEKDGTTYPETYAGITMDDAEMYHLYICGAANQMIDNWISGISQLENQMIAGVATIGALAALFAGFATFGIAWAVGLGILATAFAALQAFWDVDVFVTAADDLEDARAQLICAILDGDSAALSALVEETVSAAAWSAFFQFQNYANMVATVFAGEVDGEYITVTPTAEVCWDCVIVYDFDYTYEFASDAQGHGLNKAVWTSDRGGSIKCDPSWQGWTYIDTSEGNILGVLGLPTNTYLETRLVVVTLERYSGTPNGTPDIQMIALGETVNDSLITEYNTLASGEELQIIFEPTANDKKYCQTGSSTGFHSIRLTRDGDPNPGMWVKSLRLAGWVNPA